MEERNIRGAGKKEDENEDDRVSFGLKRKGKEIEMEMDERSLKGKGKEVQMEMHGSSSLKRKGKEIQSNYKASKRIKSEEDDDVQRLGLTKSIGIFQPKRIESGEGCSNSKSKFEYLLEAVSYFSAYEEEQDSLENMHASVSVDNEEEEGHELGELLPREFQERIQELNGSDVKFVMEKNLFSTDLNPKHARLSIPPAQITNKFLSESEESLLNECIKENGRLAGLSVTVLDPSLNEYTMCLKKWNMEKSYVYNLTKGWNQIVRQNHLQLNHKLQLWSFRISSHLCFAFVKI